MMTPENFCYFLQGFIEVSGPVTMSKQQVQIIKDHLDLVFEKKTPTYTTPFPAVCQDYSGTILG
jgi:hypothetical protein